MILLAVQLAIFSSSFTAPVNVISSDPVQKPIEHTSPPSDNSLRTPTKGARVYLIGDFLYWSANEDGLNTAYKAQGEPGQFPLKEMKIKSFSIAWNPGFRVGLGYRLPHDLWEARAYFTQFRTTNHLTQTASSTAFIDPNFGQLSGATQSFMRQEGSWHLKYKLLDIELTRQFPVSKALSLSPFLGARGAWIHQTLHEKFSGSHALNVDADNHFRAGGLRLGSDLNFYLMDYLCFFGQISASLLSGRFEDETKMELDEGLLFSGDQKPHRLCAACDLRAGAKGTIPFYRKEAFLTIGLTYDLSLWFFQNQSLSFFNAPDTVQVQMREANLTLQGVTLTTRLDF